MVGAFGQATLGGCIAEETMRAIRFNFLDVTLHADAIHRGAGQIMPPTKRVMYACQCQFPLHTPLSGRPLRCVSRPSAPRLTRSLICSFPFLCAVVSKPILMEPMYVCDITVPTSAVSGVYETLNARRGQVEGQDDRPGNGSHSPHC
jgi:elongation factor 2